LHSSVEVWTEAVLGRYNLWDADVLEIGGGGDNGSRPPLRELFGGKVTVMDRVDGAGVDIVHDAEQFFSHKTSVVLCTEVLEHTLHPWWLIHNAADALLPGGYLILSARGYDVDGCAPVHMTPHDYWRFSVAAVRSMLEDAGLTVLECVRDPDRVWRGVMAVGRKGP
jgi:hypothetical protein